MTVYLWGLIAGTLAVGIEAYSRTVPTWWTGAPVLVPLAILLNVAIWHVVKLSPSLPSAFVVFGAVTMTARTAWSLWAGHPIGRLMWGAIACNLLALLLRHLEARG